MSAEEHKAIWTEFLTNTRVEDDGSSNEVLLREESLATAARMARFFELVRQPIIWEIDRPLAARATDVALKLTTPDPDIAANRLFYSSYNTTGYTILAGFQQGFARFLVDARDSPETGSPTETIIARDPESLITSARLMPSVSLIFAARWGDNDTAILTGHQTGVTLRVQICRKCPAERGVAEYARRAAPD